MLVRAVVVASFVAASWPPMVLHAEAQGASDAKDPPIQKPQNPKALEHLAEGNKLYNVRRWSEAADEYTKAALIEPAPIIDYNLGQCYRQMSKHEEAIWHYERFIRASPQTPMHIKAVQAFIEQLQAQIASDKATKNQPPSDPAPMSANTPSDLPGNSAPIGAVRSDPLRPGAVSPWYFDSVGWALAGTGLVAVAVGGGLLVSASGLRDDANQAASQRERDELHDKASTRSLLGTTIGIGGGLLLVAGAVKLIVHDRETAPTATAVQLSVSPSGFSVFGRF